MELMARLEKLLGLTGARLLLLRRMVVLGCLVFSPIIVLSFSNGCGDFLRMILLCGLLLLKLCLATTGLLENLCGSIEDLLELISFMLFSRSMTKVLIFFTLFGRKLEMGRILFSGMISG